jgi:hypothetical protein
MAKAEISWRRRSPEGETMQVCAHHVGDRWNFFARGARYEQWQPVEKPPLEDWLALLDGVRRRADRGLLRPEEVARVEKSIRERFPDADP